jgi:hypothetical protein
MALSCRGCSVPLGERPYQACGRGLYAQTSYRSKHTATYPYNRPGVAATIQL